MKTWIKRSLAGLLGATVALGGLAACSHRYGGHGGHSATPEEQAAFKAKMVERVADKLELDATQKAKFALLADTLQAQRAAFIGSGGKPRDELKGLIAGPSFDRNRAQVLLQDKTQALQAGGPAVINALGDFYDSLRPEQQSKLRGWMEGRHGWRG